MEELLSLKWNNHRSTFLHILTVLRDKQLYTDATLACDGKFYSVHRLVLSTCSDYFSAMFDRTSTCKNPIIVLKDIKCEDLEALLDYMYLGEVNVKQADLASLIKSAECLRVKGLAVPDDEPPPKRGKSDTSNVRRTDGSGSPPSKRKRREEGHDRGNTRPKSPHNQSRLGLSSRDEPESESTTQGNNISQSSNDGQLPTVKVERVDDDDDDIGIIDNFVDTNKFKEELQDNDAGDPGGSMDDLSEFMQSDVDGSYGDEYPGTSSFQPGEHGWQGDGSDLNYSGQPNFNSNDSSSQNAQGVLASLSGVASMENSASTQSTACPVCGKSFSSMWHMTRHLRTHTGERPFPCPFCPYRATQKNALQRHVQNLHPQGYERLNLLQKKKRIPEIASTPSSKITSFAALLESPLLDSSFFDNNMLSSTTQAKSTLSDAATKTTVNVVTTTTSSIIPSISQSSVQAINSLPSFSRALSMLAGSGVNWPSILTSDTFSAVDQPNP